MAFLEGPARIFSSPASRMDHQTQSGSHKTLSRPGWPDMVFAFHDGEEIGPRMLARIAKHTGLRPEDL
jgi:hypothetical protein